jgi:hypothetical protein
VSQHRSPVGVATTKYLKIPTVEYMKLQKHAQSEARREEHSHDHTFHICEREDHGMTTWREVRRVKAHAPVPAQDDIGRPKGGCTSETPCRNANPHLELNRRPKGPQFPQSGLGRLVGALKFRVDGRREKARNATVHAMPEQGPGNSQSRLSWCTLNP